MKRSDQLCGSPDRGPVREDFVKSNKNNFVDADAIAQAVEQKTMRFRLIETCADLSSRPQLFSCSHSATIHYQDRFENTARVNSEDGLPTYQVTQLPP